MLAFIHAASISTAVFHSSGVRLSLSQSCSLYVGQCACNRHHTGCYRTSRPITRGEKVPVSCHFESAVASIHCVHPPLPSSTIRAQRKVFSRFISHSQQCRNELASSTPPTPTPLPENTSSRNDAFLHGLHRAACIDE